MPHEAKLEHFRHLNLVTTLAEACRMYGRDRKTVLYAIDANNLAARKEGGIWLISTASLMAYWDRPTYPQNNEISPKTG